MFVLKDKLNQLELMLNPYIAKNEVYVSSENSDQFSPSVRNLDRSFPVCGARYKTRPGLSYHYNHSHKEKGPNDPIPTSVSGMEELAHEEGVSAPSSVGGSSITPPSTPGLQESSIPQMEIVPGGPAAATGAKYGKKIKAAQIICLNQG